MTITPEAKSILVLGGSSDIAIAIVKKLVAEGFRRVVLAGRNAEALQQAAAQVHQVDSTIDIEIQTFNALDFESHEPFIAQQFIAQQFSGDQFSGDHFDIVLVAFAVLGDQQHEEQTPLAAVKTIETNFTGAASVLLSIANHMRQARRGKIIVLSSVAAERARWANFIYGSSKAGLDAFCQGMGDSLVGTGVSLLIVRPGFVETKMTSGRVKKPMSTTADRVAIDTVKALNKNSAIVWSPAILRYVFIAIRHLPRNFFRRIKI